ncbi:MAG: peptidase M20 [Gammaproteobacteria bacterium]|nr:MAG: peptidase M20 [Gammaproteobacteria bacterium]
MTTPFIPTLAEHSIIEIRHYLHRHPELSGAEYQTANYIAEQLQTLSPTAVYQGIAKTGVAAVFDSGYAGKSLLFRCELDALPIQESHEEAYRSCRRGIAHQCGHDGHMAIILQLAKAIAAKPPRRGRVVLLFQPAEETGEGANAVVADPQFSAIRCDECFALHNLPGYPLGEVIIRAGTFNCASRGMAIYLSGRTAHAAHPETGISPQLAVATLLQSFDDIPKQINADELRMITVVHCDMGEKVFGTTPADACLMATLRSESDVVMQQLVTACSDLVAQLAKQHHLQYHIDWADVFAASVNDERCVKEVVDAAKKTGNTVRWIDAPFRWSEDFGALSAASRGAMFAFGAGENQAQIHNPDYRFADALIQQGSDLFFEIYRQLR